MILTTYVSAEKFLDLAFKEFTYQHGSELLREEIIKRWVKEGELQNKTGFISKQEIARILVRALGLEKDEKNLEDYMNTAKKHGLFDGTPEHYQNITFNHLETIFENCKEILYAGIDNRGVKEISVEDFMKAPGDLGYQLSPDGNYLSYASSWNNRLNVFVKKMNSKSEPERITSVTDRDIAMYFWKDNTILYLKDNGGDENYHIYSSTLNGAKEQDLTPNQNVRVLPVNNLVGVKDEILVMMNKENPQYFDVYKLNVKTGQTKLVAKNPGNITSWIADNDGHLRVAIQSDGVKGTILYRDSEDKAFKPFIEVDLGDDIIPVAFAKDNQSIYALSNQNRDKIELVQYDLQGNEKVIYSNPNVDITSITYDANQGKLLYALYVTDKFHYQFFDTEFEKLFNKVKNKLGVSESELGLNGFNKEKTKFIVSVGNDKTYGTYYFYDTKTDTLTELAELGSWLNPSDLSEMNPISYKSRDGLTINGYLTLPNNKIPENLPLIVIPHGGPWMRDYWVFNPEVQLLANRGYAVLQVNFRSSMGYGKEFLEAGNKQWGLKIQDDITDGVHWAIEQGIADPERIGIYGASFGGYATLAGITFTPDLYAAAVDYVGVSNIFTLLDTIPPYWESMRNLLYERVGHPVKDKELLTSVSPVFHVDKIKTPLFVAQGTNDPRVNKQESDQIVNALRSRGVDVEYMVKDNEGHGFNNEENQIEFYNAMVKFFDEHLK